MFHGVASGLVALSEETVCRAFNRWGGSGGGPDEDGAAMIWKSVEAAEASHLTCVNTGAVEGGRAHGSGQCQRLKVPTLSQGSWKL